jgi:hypothetical protein
MEEANALMSGQRLTEQDRHTLQMMRKFVAAIKAHHLTPEKLVRIVAVVEKAAQEIAKEK